MIKKLDTLIIKAFIGPFFATFLISLFVLVMQFFWLYIDDLVGKGLDVFTILKLVGYVSATLVPLALPLALLLSSIMTFGNLGESFELVAIKSAGISLSRFMRPLLIVAIIIAGVAFLFSNNIIPVANLKLNALKYDIIVAKPAFDIKEGIFYDKMEGFVIKIGKKEKDDSTIRNVMIYEKSFVLQDNVILANNGVMRMTPDNRYMEFVLYDGWRYQERGNRLTTNTEFIRLGFKEYRKLFDLSSFELNQTPDTLFQYDPKMLSVRQLDRGIDSLNNANSAYAIRVKKEGGYLLPFIRNMDSSLTIKKVAGIKARNFDELIPVEQRTLVAQRAISQVSAAKPTLEILLSDFYGKKKSLNFHLIEWHRKFTLSVACIVLFMIGAPLGSIIRKGGLGTPLVAAIVFFVLFHLINTFGSKFAEESVTSPFVGMWLSTFILLPIGIFLTIKAMKDSTLFNQEGYFRFFSKIRRMLPKKSRS